MPLRQRRLDRRLAFGEPVERGVEFILIDRAQAQHDAETVRRRRRIERPRRRQLRRWGQQAGDDHRQYQIAAAVALRPEQPIEADRTTVPSTAATWPCGSDRRIVSASEPGGSTLPPFRSARRPSMR